jgi:hypothetical protein
MNTMVTSVCEAPILMDLHTTLDDDDE